MGVDPTLTAAIGLASTLVVGAVAARQTRRLDIERKLKDRELNAEDVLTKYREPLTTAAFDLQSRCYNIVNLDFFGPEKFGKGHERFAQAQKTTLFRFAQYFGWTELLRRDVQFLSFPEAKDTQRVAELQNDIARELAESKDSEILMIWTDEQRAVGERMIVEEHGKLMCMGYARFCDDYDAHFKMLCDRMCADLHDPDAKQRLSTVQALLCDLVRALDQDALRYSEKQIGRPKRIPPPPQSLASRLRL
ncbi:MAG: hypothetical protein QOJ35_2113 [Solirubrobacteraceae bacterium]|nr:hypothetical protein [Solirubrobacteraceae bacterium]